MHKLPTQGKKAAEIIFSAPRRPDTFDNITYLLGLGLACEGKKRLLLTAESTHTTKAPSCKTWTTVTAVRS